jgi:hypothetical protein
MTWDELREYENAGAKMIHRNGGDILVVAA